MVIAIAAIDKNNGIGYNGDLLVHIPEDLKYFSEKTNEKIIIMGKKTYQSLPVKKLNNSFQTRILTNRINLIITNSVQKNDCILQNDGSYFVGLNYAKQYCLQFKNSKPDIFIVGGASIYNEFLDICDQLYLTEIDYSFNNVDTYFPIFKNKFHLKKQSEIHQYKNYKFKFCIYEK